MRLQYLSGLAGALLGISLACAAQAETLSVGAVGSANAVVWPHYIALSKGFYAAEGLSIDLVYAQSSAAVLQALTAGSTEIAIAAGFADPIHAVEQGAGVAVVRIDGQAGPYALMAKKQFKSIKDLKGKTISADEAKGTTMVYLLKMLEGNGLKRSDVELIYAGATAARFAALESGAADAAIITAPQLFRAQAEGFVNLGYSVDYAKNVPFTGDIANRAWAAGHKESLHKFLAAYGKAIAWFDDEKNRGEAIDILLKASKQDQGDIAKSYDFLRKIDYFAKTDAVSLSQLDTFIKALQQLDPSVHLDVHKLVMPEVTRVVN